MPQLGEILYLEDGEVLEHAVHHVLLRQLLQLMDEADHVFAHGGALNLVHEPGGEKSRKTR